MRRALEVLGLGLLTLACSLPLVTLGASAAALYYALAKSVRRGRGSPWREFFRSFRQNLLPGLGLTAILALLLAVAYFSALYVVNRPLSGLVDVFYCLTLALASLAAALVVSLTLPALSRFSFKVPQLLGFTLRLARRFPLRALALALMSLAAAALCWIFPPALPLLPGGLCLASTWLIEPMFRSFMPPREDFPPEVDTWYLE